MNLCRADKLLLTGGAAVLGSSALFGASALSIGVPAGALVALLADASEPDGEGAAEETS